MRRIFRPQILIPFIAGVLFNIVSDLLASLVGDSDRGITTGIVVALLLFGAGSIYYQIHQRRTTVLDRTPLVLREPKDWLPNAHKGLIVFVSLYNPFKSPTAKALTVEQRLAAAEAGEYEKLDFENSNLMPIITAIDRHGSRLEHCWLIGTTANSGNKRSSLTYVPVLEQYLREKRGAKCQFHSGDQYAVRIDDDAQVTTKTRNLIERIFTEAHQLGVPEKEILADFTAGPRSMVLGLFWACVDGKRDVQFVGTHYDEEAKPIGEVFPIIFSFDTERQE
ncbi:hypothetical protein MNBD_CHLOROFLEXI01-4966 [hydrothermal vent metagenome]|uniref:Uncharacterized protein n=1 Tax=hydrothermal vent metagenome TaxID=652676 RepID=A0A3B0V0I6_9ZZZZ